MPRGANGEGERGINTKFANDFELRALDGGGDRPS